MSLTNRHIGIVIMAAGNSSRLGTPKQLLKYQGKTLLEHAIDEAINAEISNVLVVLGTSSTSILPVIDQSRVTIVENRDWEEGMASSLIIGLDTILRSSANIDGVIFMVCDQPFVSTALLNELISKHHQTGKGLIASKYGEIVGTPAFVHCSYFEELRRLKGDEGAKKIFKNYPDQTETVDFPGGGIDIDNKEDYDLLIKREFKETRNETEQNGSSSAHK